MKNTAQLALRLESDMYHYAYNAHIVAYYYEQTMVCSNSEMIKWTTLLHYERHYPVTYNIVL